MPDKVKPTKTASKPAAAPAPADPQQPQAKAPRIDELRTSLQAQEKQLEDELRPFRELYEQHVNDAKYIEARKKIKELSARLAPIKNELAALARAGGAKASLQAEPGEYSGDEKGA